MSPRFYNRIGKVCGLVAATLVFPAMALAGTDNGNENGGQNNGNPFGKDKGGYPVSSVPEANAGWVLVPFLGVLLLVSTRQFLRRSRA
jgi:hypothetical protein